MATATKEHKRNRGTTDADNRSAKASAAQPIKRLSEHWVNGAFYGFKSMIGGRRFYFFRDFGITTNGDADAKKANEAATIYRREWERLSASGFDQWTDDAVDRAKAAARLVLVGAPLPTPTDNPSAVASPASGDGNATATPSATTAARPAVRVVPAVGGMTLHQAIDAFVAKQRERVASEGLDADTVEGYASRLNAVKAATADLPLAAVGYDQLSAMVAYWTARPPTKYGKPASIQWVKSCVAMFLPLFKWAKKAGHWKSFEDWQELFVFDADRERRLMTPKERKAEKDRRQQLSGNGDGEAISDERYTVEELGILYANAPKRLRLYMLLALNCGMGAKEIATLYDWDVQLGKSKAGGYDYDADYRAILADEATGVIDRERHKTGVQARWVLWRETAQTFAEVLNDQNGVTPEMRRSLRANGYVEAEPDYKRDKGGKATADKRQPPTPANGGSRCWSDWVSPYADLCLRTEDGYPLVHRGGKKNRKTDAVAQSLTKLMKRDGVRGKVRQLGFYAFRKTAAQMVREASSLETSKVFLAHATLEETGRKSVSEKHYTERSQVDFDRVAAALVKVRERLQPMFDAKATNPVKPKALAGMGRKKGKATATA